MIVVHLGLTSAAPTSSGADVAPSACWRVRVSALRGCPDRVYQVAKREMPVAFYVADILPELAGWCPPADLKIVHLARTSGQVVTFGSQNCRAALIVLLA